MLVYNDKRLVPTDVDVMVLQDASQNYFYIHRMLYDQTVILEDKYHGDYHKLAQDIMAPNPVPTDRSDVDFFFEHTPHPINILAPFLLLCPEAFDDLVDMVGALHVMSNTFSFKRIPETDPSIRLNAMRFSMSIKEEYQLGWNNFFMGCIEYSNDMFLGNKGTNYMSTNSRPTTSNTSNDVEEEEEEDSGVPQVEYVDEDHIRMPVFDFEALLDEANAKSEQERLEKEAAEQTASSTAAPEPAPEILQTTEEKPAGTSGMDFLKSLK